ncbi:MAG: alpha/beta fold hydrolase [Hyphomonadaceae bacterium]|nr:alpha/beta fold hydrolase [Hyphomonadaceae bacterium]
MSASDPEVEEFLAVMSAPPRRRAVPRLAEPLRDAEMRKISGPQGAIAAWRVGEGPAALLVHGYEDDNSIWTAMIDALTQSARAVVALDLPAHGFSEGAACFPSDAADVLAPVAAALGPIQSVVAHSMGCVAAAMAIDKGLKAERFAVIASPTRINGRWRRMAEAMGVPDDVAEKARTLYQARVGPARTDLDPAQVFRRLRTKMLFVHSIDDERTPFAGVQDVADACRDAQVLAVAGHDHRGVAMDKDVVARIAEFVG